ncbi:MAG: metal ABC transporter permease, partial [Thermoflexales bacterium]
IVAGAQTVGVLMVTALLITPAAAASLLTKRLPRMIVYATAFAVASVFVGLYASYYLEVSSGAAIVLSASLIFAAAWIVNLVRQRRTAGTAPA